MELKPASALNAKERERLRALLGEHAVLQFYLESALADLERGIDNREFGIAQSGAGAVIGIRFDRATIRTTFGELSAADMEAGLGGFPAAGEVHLQAEHWREAERVLGSRIRATHRLRYYLLRSPSGAQPDRRCLRMGPADLESLQRFYGEFYPGTIFSSWMLEQPFFAIRGEREGEFLASGGVVAAHAGLGSANLGNFLTHPQHRGRGLAQAVTATLLHALEGEGYREFTLGTYEENRPACRVYEAVGFRLLEERIQADIAAG